MEAFLNRLWTRKQKWKHFPIHYGPERKNGSLSEYIMDTKAKMEVIPEYIVRPKAKMEVYSDTFPSAESKNGSIF